MARDYDHLFKLLIIGDSGEFLIFFYFCFVSYVSAKKGSSTICGTKSDKFFYLYTVCFFCDE